MKVISPTSLPHPLHSPLRVGRLSRHSPARIALIVAERRAAARICCRHSCELSQSSRPAGELVLELVVAVLLRVPAGAALAAVRAGHLRLVALAVVLQAVGLLAVAALLVEALHVQVATDLGGNADLRLEGAGVALQGGLDGAGALLLVLEVVVAVLAVAVQAKPEGKG